MLHSDGTITHFDIFRQQWMREMHLSDQVLASMGTTERERVQRHLARHDLG